MEKLTLAQMPDSWIYFRLSEITETIEKTVASVHGVLNKEIVDKREQYAAEALVRLQR